jgi:flagellar operon protein
MDLKKLQTLDSLRPVQPGKVNNTTPAGTGPSFQDTLNQVAPQAPAGATAATSGVIGGLKAPPNLNGIKFSNHAIDRMRSRGISYGPEDIAKINDAVGRAAAKGSKDSLILMNDSALIVSVKNNTVVTVMDKNALKENVFTNIDSTIVL